MLSPDEISGERRLGRRYSTATQLFYTSEALAFDAVASDLSLSGVFVVAELLDEVGTKCQVALLPDGSPPVRVRGVVRRVVADEDRTGMGVEFTVLDPDAEQWLVHYIARASEQP
jgi:hypothetical protein